MAARSYSRPSPEADGLVMRCVVSLLLVSTGLAQIPDGHLVTSTFSSDTPAAAPGGVFVSHPRDGTVAQPILGLGADLTGSASPGIASGANCVAVVQNDGSIYVGEIDSSGATIDLHAITLQGLTAVSDRKISVGTAIAGTAGGIAQIALAPSGDVYAIVSGLQVGPPLHGAAIARIRPSTGAVSPVPISPAPNGLPNAIAIDPQRDVLYFAAGGGGSQIFSVPTTGGAPSLVAASISTIAALAIGADGMVYYSSSGASPAVLRVDPQTGGVELLAVLPGVTNGMALERATGNVVVAITSFVPTRTSSVLTVTPGGVTTAVSSLPSGAPSGMAVRHSPRAYGQPSPSQFSYAWQVEPHPGGLPRLGNAGFGLQVNASAGGTPAGFLLGSTAAGSAPVAGITLLLATRGLKPLTPIPPSGVVPLPIPNDPSLVGKPAYLQSVHIDAAGLGASDGLVVGILP